MNVSNIPEELLQKRDAIECNFIMSLWKMPDLIPDYRNIENGEDIFTEDGQFYYGIITALYKAGYKTFDNMSVYTFLEDKKTLKKGFEKRGGWNTIEEITSLLSEENFNTYYDELIKNNLLIRLYNKGFNIIDKLDKFNQMTSSEIYDYWEYQLSNITTDKIEKIQVEDLSNGNLYKEAIREWDKGSDVGFRISSKMLNYQLLGVHKKNLMLHLAGIGFGKTSSAVAWYILPSLIDGTNVTVVANEQDKEAWMKMILSTVLFNYIGFVEGFSRHKLSVGSYTDEQFDKMDKAADWLDKQPGKLSFVELEDYNIASVKKIITRQSKLGNELFIFDTMKGQNDASERAWGEFSEVAKELFLLAKHLNVAIVATAQLSPEAMSRKFLDLTCIGRAKSIAETATSVCMFRPLMQEEVEKIKGYNYDGKIKKEITLDPNKSYICIYTPKNRYGNVSPQIIMERNLNFNTYKDVCWWDCPYDNYKKG